MAPGEAECRPKGAEAERGTKEETGGPSALGAAWAGAGDPVGTVD